MKLKIVLNKNIAFSSYLRNVINLKNWPWIRRGPLKGIPLKFSREAEKYNPSKLTYEQHPLKDFEQNSRKVKKLIREVEKIHNQEWQKYQRELRNTAKALKEIAKDYGSFIVKTIATLTKDKWPYSEVWVVPSIYDGGTVVNNKVFIGCDKRPKERFVSLIIHELIHVNQPHREEAKKLEKDLKLPTDSREITTVLLTNKVIDLLNKRFKLAISYQQFHPEYRKLITKYESDLKKLRKNKRSYNSLIKAVDEFLVKKKYKGYYSRYIR